MADMLRRMDRHTEQMDRQSGQIDDIIGILKVSDARHTRMEERQDKAEVRQDAMLLEIKQQGARLDTLLQTQMKMLELMSNNANRTDEMERKFPVITAYEARFQRLEAAVFNKAS